MQIVIEIPEEEYAAICYNVLNEREHSYGYVAIANGKPLPKGHGDLVDRSKICKAIPAEEDNCIGMWMSLEEMEAYNEGINTMFNLVQRAKSIIAADKEVTDGSSN